MPRGLQLVIPVFVITTFFASLHFIANSWQVHVANQYLVEYTQHRLPPPSASEIDDLETQLRDRVDFYVSQIEMQHISQGMVINRGEYFTFRDNCDSLLFSSLYFVGLRKLGYFDRAERTWQAIIKQHNGGIWRRHPHCAKKATSRDQILGVLAALSQKPTEQEAFLRSFLVNLQNNKGFFSHGAMYVSYLTPGMADLVRRFSRVRGIPHSQLPDCVRRSFSTVDFTSSLVKSGYQAHLASLNLWLEMELQGQAPHMPGSRSFAAGVSWLFESLTPVPAWQQRLAYLSEVLATREPRNLFFRYLRLRTAKAWNEAVRVDFMRELLRMSQFPVTRLPSNCDRKADYLWQRAGHEYHPKEHECRITFSGVDFVWMAALLLEKHPQTETVSLP